MDTFMVVLMYIKKWLTPFNGFRIGSIMQNPKNLYAKNALYFTKANWVGICLWVIIGIIICAATGGNGFAILIGIIIILAMVIPLILLKIFAATETQIDDFARQKGAKIEAEGIVELGIDPAEVSLVEPLLIVQYTSIRLKTNCLIKNGKSSNCAATCFYFSQNQLFVYKRVFSIISNEQSTESNEFYYNDIVLVNNSKKDENSSACNLEIKLSSGDTFNYTFEDNTETQKKLLGLKNLIRDKRNK